MEPGVSQDQAWTLTLPLTIRLAVVPTRALPLGPEAFVTTTAIVPPATVPFRLIGRHFAFAPWLDVEVEVEVFGP